MTSPAPLLELRTLDPVDRPFITIDGVRYDLNADADFSLLSLNRLDQMHARVQALQSRQRGGPGPLSDEDAAELTDALREVVAQVLRAPREVLDRLSDVQRFAVLQAFSPASQLRTPAAAAKPKTVTRRTGARSSRASRASTAATSAG